MILSLVAIKVYKEVHSEVEQKGAKRRRNATVLHDGAVRNS